MLRLFATVAASGALCSASATWFKRSPFHPVKELDAAIRAADNPQKVGLLVRLCQRVKGIAEGLSRGKPPLPKSGTLWEVHRQGNGELMAKNGNILNFEDFKADTLNYRTATDLFVLNDDSPLFHPDFFLPLAVMANLSLERTWSSRAGGLLLRRKYAPRWEAFMKPLLKFVDRLSDSGLLIQKNGMPGGEQPPEFAAFLDGSCDGLSSQQYTQDRKLTSTDSSNSPRLDSRGGCADFGLGGKYGQKVDDMIEGLRIIRGVHYEYYGADPGMPREWLWENAILVAKMQLWCSLRKREPQGEVEKNFQTLMKSPSLTEDISSAMLAKRGEPHKFLTLLSKDLPEGWQFTRGKMGLFRRGLSWFGERGNAR